MPAYVDEPFPLGVIKGSRGGPRMSMSVSELDSGVQERATRWPSFRWEYDVGVGLQNLDLLDLAYDHHLAVGPENSFPYKDPQDFTSAANNRAAPSTTNPLDQVLGIGDSTNGTNGTAVYPLLKLYTSGTRTYWRFIRKPKAGTITVSVAGTIKTLGTHYTVNFSTGEITFTAGNVPTTGQLVRASFEFYVPVMYGAEFNYKTVYGAVTDGRIPDLTLIEDVTQGTITPEFMFQGSGDTITFSVDMAYDYSWGSSVVFDPTVTPLAITLPDINEPPLGGPYFWFYNKGTAKTINFKNKATAATEFSLTGGTGTAVLIQNNAGTRQWVAF